MIELPSNGLKIIRANCFPFHWYYLCFENRECIVFREALFFPALIHFFGKSPVRSQGSLRAMIRWNQETDEGTNWVDNQLSKIILFFLENDFIWNPKKSEIWQLLHVWNDKNITIFNLKYRNGFFVLVSGKGMEILYYFKPFLQKL